MSIAGVINGQASVTAILRGSGLAPVPIHWTAASDAVDGYNIYRGTAPGLENFKVNVALITGTSFVDYNAPRGLNYYIVKSSIQGVESQVSNEVAIGLVAGSAVGHCVVGGIIRAVGPGPLAATITGKASVGGTLKAAGKLAGVVAGHASVSGFTTNSGFIISRITGHATTTAAMTGAGRLLSQPIGGQASVAGQLKGKTSIAGAIAGQATVMAHTTQFSNITGHASVGGTLKGSTHLSDSITGHVTVAGTLKGSAAVLSGSISGHASVSGAIKGKTSFASSITGHASVAGTVKGKTSLASSITGQASVQLVENLLASITGHASVAGTLKGKSALIGAIAGQASVSGTLPAVGILAGAVAGKATITAVIDKGLAIAGNIAGQASVAGTLSGTGNVLTFIVRQAQVGLVVPPGPIFANVAGQASVSATPTRIHFLSSFITGNASVSLKNNPFIPTLVQIGQSVGRGFACSASNPALVLTYQNSLQTFNSGLPVPPIGTPDGWGNLGQRVMMGQLLLAPGNGRLPGRSLVAVASGDVTIPVGSSSVSANFILNQNYFTITNQTITTYSVPMSTLSIPAPLLPGTYAWSITCRLSDNGSNNGFAQGNFTITINGVTTNGVASSNFNPSVQPQFQLSMGVQFTGTPGPNPFQARMIQFELQQA